MLSLDRILLRFFIPRLLSDCCGESVPLSGEEGEKVNCFTVTIPKGDQPDLVLLRYADSHIEALQFDGNHYTINTTLTLEMIDPRRIHATHRYGLASVHYRGIWDVAFGRFTRLPYIRIHVHRAIDRLAQHLFNRRSLTTQRRVEILREVVELSINHGKPIDAMDLMFKKFGYRWAGHPDGDAYHRTLETYLELLVDSGELARDSSYNFRPTGLALKSLEDNEESDRKHSANFRVQMMLTILAALSVFMAAAQAGLIKLPVLLELTGEKPPTHKSAH